MKTNKREWGDRYRVQHRAESVAQCCTGGVAPTGKYAADAPRGPRLRNAAAGRAAPEKPRKGNENQRKGMMTRRAVCNTARKVLHSVAQAAGRRPGPRRAAR